MPKAAHNITDPIFAAIEAHRAAFAAFSATVKAQSGLLTTDDYEAADKAAAQASDVMDVLATALTTTAPTTMAGVLALLAYVDDFNRGVVGGSEHHNWPEDLTDDDVTTAAGRPLTMPFAYWLLRNVQTALKALA